jgi:anti-sigma B factor antagonist
MNLKIESHVTDAVTVLTCHGRISFGEEAQALRDMVKQVLATTKKIILDLSGVTYMDSGGLGSLVGSYSSARQAGADVKLIGLGPRLRETLHITKLVTVFEVYDNEKEALAAFRAGLP